MKPARFLSILLAIPAWAQSSATYGTRIGQVQTAYLADVPASTAAALDISDRFREIVNATRSSGIQVPLPDSVKGPRAEFETWAEQRTRDYAESVVTRITGIEREAGKATIHRTVRDNFRQTEQTYTITLERTPGTADFRVTFRDATVPVPVPQIVHDGETLALDLAADARSGRKLVDYIRIGTGVMKPRQEPARDVYAEDAELSITEPRLRVNGKEQPASSLTAPLSAPVVWVDIPGQGRYLLSFKPRTDQGFQRAGEVIGNSLVFSSGGNIFRIESADRIANGSATYNIYVRQDPGGESPAVIFGVER
jgi:hypothetical protein